jgi:hypothetical protein
MTMTKTLEFYQGHEHDRENDIDHDGTIIVSVMTITLHMAKSPSICSYVGDVLPGL